MMMLLVVGLPLGVSMAASYFYSRLILEARAAALDDQHRLTLLPPWFFFDRVYSRGARRLNFWGLWLYVFLSYGTIIAMLIPAVYTAASPWPLFFAAAWGPPVVIGLQLIFRATILWQAPNFSNPWKLTLAGVIPATGALIVIPPMIPDAIGFIGMALLPLVGYAAFAAAWLRVRFKNDREWFGARE